jgi:hypothetical protein
MDPNAMLLAVVTLFSYVRGSAANLEMELDAEQETGLTDKQWVEAQDGAFKQAFASGRYPTLQSVAAHPLTLDAESLFEFGLERLLDGYASDVRRAHRPGKRVPVGRTLPSPVALNA